MIHKSLIIVGGGPVGMTTAIKLAKCGYADITILDARLHSSTTNLSKIVNQPQDGRVLALSYASCQLLDNIGVWDKTLATAIKQVHVSHSGPGISHVHAEDMHLPELGYTVKYSDLCNKLHQCICDYPQIKFTQAVVKEVIPGKNYATIVYDDGQYLTADLVILAEGGKIKPTQVEYKEYDYKQIAITATLKTELKHNNTAFERFDAAGALVLLPHESTYTLVWSLAAVDAQNLNEPEYLAARLKELRFMKRFGKFEIQGKIHHFPLKLQVAKNRVLDRIVLVGSSAQIVHPLSAQGLNLGLRDVEALTRLIGDDITKINEYNKLRLYDSKFVIGFTHSLVRLLEAPYIGHLRGLGLMALANLKLLQNKLTRSLIFGN